MKNPKLPRNHYKALIEPAMELGRTLDVKNPAREALFDVPSGCINVWCTPDDHPEGPEWDQITMTAGAFSKPAEYVGMITWERDGKGLITEISISSDAFVLSDQLPEKFVDRRRQARNGLEYIGNRPIDTQWVLKKALWLFKQTGIDLEQVGVRIVLCSPAR